MITPSKVIDLAYQITEGSPLKAAITGDIYKIRRALNSDKEDVVINTLSVNNEQVQQGIVNINIHVRNLRLGNGSNQDNTRPNFARLDQLTEIFKPVFEGDLYVSETVFSIQNITIIPEENIPEYFVNFRIIFYSKNI